MQDFEFNKKERSFVISALPKIHGVQDDYLVVTVDIDIYKERSMLKKIMTRRDITLNRIFM